MESEQANVELDPSEQVVELINLSSILIKFTASNYMCNFVHIIYML